jgi:hypothetical protein
LKTSQSNFANNVIPQCEVGIFCHHTIQYS